MTEKDREALEAFIWYQGEFGCPPSLKELMPLLNLRAFSAMRRRLQRLVALGHLVHRPRRHCVYVLASACGRGDKFDAAMVLDRQRPLLGELESAVNEGLL